MKAKKLIKPIFVVIIASMFIACDETFTNPKPDPDYPSDVLPEETQVGANRLGCLLNGEVFANSKYVQVGFNQRRIEAYYAVYPRNTFLIYAYAHDKTWISLSIDVDSLIVNDTVKIQEIRYNTALSEDYVYLKYIDDENGKLYLTRFDTINQIISGNFEFTAHSTDQYGNLYGDSIIHGTNGRFDIQYTLKYELPAD